MKKPKFIPEFKDIPTKRRKMAELSLEERHLSFEEVELGFTEKEAVAEAKRCLSCRRCIGCGLCLAECDPQAIVYDQKPEKITLNVGAIILAPGFAEFDAKRKRDLGYGNSFNVITSIEFERILSPTGPYGGVVMRPFDGEIPKRIAFIQCVGSREEGLGANFCSNVCCMYALKEAIAAHERIPDLNVTFFHRDIRPLTKGSEDYYLKAKNDLCFTFNRANVDTIQEDETTGTVTVEYSENGTSQTGDFDLVVLSVGLHTPTAARKVLRSTRIRPNKYGFCPVSAFTPLNTPNEGVYVAGAFSGPKDISETMAQASGAAAKAAAAISANGSRPAPSEKRKTTFKDEKARIGLFFCQYGNSTQGNFDLEALKKHAEKLQDVIHVGESLYCCLHQGRQEIQGAVQEKGVNRIVITPCYSKSHHQLFGELAGEFGLNPEHVGIVDFGFGCGDIEEAKKSIAQAIENVRAGTSQEIEQSAPVPAALVLGGGLTGMTAALDVAEQGFEVHLVDKADTFGGHMQSLRYLLGEEDPMEKVKSIIERIEAHEKIHVHTHALLKKLEGEVGHFKSTLSENGTETVLDHGVLIVTTGASTYKPDEFHYGKDQNVLTQTELEQKLKDGEFKGKNVVMIQCVGSRDEAHSYCSRICCEEAIKNTHKIKEVNTEAQVTILHRDMRVYGFNEDYLTEAEEKGVQFIRMDGPPDVSNTNGLTVSVVDRYTKKETKLNPDLVVLSTGLVPSENNIELARLLDIKLDKDGFFQEADSKMRPVDTDREGIFICGLAHSPQSVSESLSQASAAAGKVGLILGN
ncbi:MAG: FAD-dependent oxidoreductase [Gemmatimonadota bacterium]|nr:MAG: FAD-dependent oxidoreductase [Gemmatimonadota bacterium]